MTKEELYSAYYATLPILVEKVSVLFFRFEWELRPDLVVGSRIVSPQQKESWYFTWLFQKIPFIFLNEMLNSV